MATLKCSGITSISVAGFIGNPDDDGLVDVPAEIMASEEWSRLVSELPPGAIVIAPEVADDSEEEEAKELRATLKDAKISFGPRTKIEKLRELVAGIKAKG